MSITFKDNSANIAKLIEEAVDRALERIGLEAEGNAVDKITDNDSVVTGNLRNSITHKVDAAEDKVYVGTDVEYAPYVELGTGIHAEGGGGRPTPWVYQDSNGDWHRTSGQEPKPFLRPAAKDHKKDYANILEDELQQALK
jgi:HK97 gp10 family phage protein